MSTSVRTIQGIHASETRGQTKISTTFGEIEYNLDQAPAGIISFQAPAEGLISGSQGDVLPCAVINWSEDQLKKADLDAISTKFALRDDVWTSEFLEGKTSCRFEISIMTTKNETPIDSRHSPNTPNFENICCARWDLCFPKHRVYSIAGRPLCNPAVNWRSPSCIAAI